MSAMLAALFKDHATAERVRTALVSSGFATDRVQLTSEVEPGQVSLMPRGDKSQQLHDYFKQVFTESSEDQHLRSFIDGVRQGNAAVVVHPRGDIETRTAVDVL